VGQTNATPSNHRSTMIVQEILSPPLPACALSSIRSQLTCHCHKRGLYEFLPLPNYFSSIILFITLTTVVVIRILPLFKGNEIPKKKGSISVLIFHWNCRAYFCKDRSWRQNTDLIREFDCLISLSWISLLSYMFWSCCLPQVA